MNGLVFIYLSNLTNDELLEFAEVIKGPLERNYESVCSGYPWFDKIKGLFIEKGLSEDLRKEIFSLAEEKIRYRNIPNSSKHQQ